MGRPRKVQPETLSAEPKNVKELVEAGYDLTPEIWHTGNGDGRVYEKIVDGVRKFVRVDENGNVVPTP